MEEVKEAKKWDVRGSVNSSADGLVNLRNRLKILVEELGMGAEMKCSEQESRGEIIDGLTSIEEELDKSHFLVSQLAEILGIKN